jgi:cytochrome oxidase Cu insertion factor (SCO1/SenC/PrrC family)
MMIKHDPQFDIEKVCKHYSEKDGVPVKYVCTSTTIKEGLQATDIFYRDTPHPEFGNRYFGLYQNHSGNMMITNADKVEDFEFGLIEDDDGNLQYSAHRHDYKKFENGNMIDGGRSYIKSSGCPVYMYVVRHGKMVKKNDYEKNNPHQS